MIIEEEFPSPFVSVLAEHESWRKEVYRPIYHVHKWWANRLGSVFRAIIIGSCSHESSSIESQFYKHVKFPDVVIFDPFMGSGTTVGEAIKLGCKVIGKDINPVSYMMTKTALQSYSKTEVEKTFQDISKLVEDKIMSFYSTKLKNGQKRPILYYFWIKMIPCPECREEIELFKKRIFVKNAYPNKVPDARACCPQCGAINHLRFDDTKKKCDKCGFNYNPQKGTIKNSIVSCPFCNTNFKLIDEVRRKKSIMDTKMYAKCVLLDDGKRSYQSIDSLDVQNYQRANKIIKNFMMYIPRQKINPGYNTNQILNYNYQYWYQMFNSRQLVCIAYLVSAIRKIENPDIKLLFACLLSGTLEFNNTFTSFKGEGTGAVRHLFAHHILKPELMSLEANVWGTTKSSGSFLTLFHSRILRALDYKQNPFELKVSTENGLRKSTKVFGISNQINQKIVSTYKQFQKDQGVYLSVGDSSKTDLTSCSIDLVITDPPFFDNVHYSQLSDFFFVWLRKMLGKLDWLNGDTSRSCLEVQSTSMEEFTEKLTSVLKECRRVLKNDGILVLTYHHSRTEGWLSLYHALRQSGFTVENTYPVKSEMTVAVSIHQSTNPITYDLIVVCRKNNKTTRTVNELTINENAERNTLNKIKKIENASLKISHADKKIILIGSLMSEISKINDFTKEIKILEKLTRGIS